MASVNTAQGASAETGATVSTSAFVATAGNLIAVAVSTYEDTSAVSNVTDTAGNSYTRVRGDTHPYAGSQEVWVAYNSAGHASNVVVATFNASVASGRRIITEQFNGRATSRSPVLASGVGSVTFSTSVTTSSFNPGETFSDVFAAACTSGFDFAGDSTPGNYTKRQTVTSPPTAQSYDRVSAPTGGQTVNVTWANNGDVLLTAVALAQEIVVKTVSGTPAANFGLAGNPAVTGTQLLTGALVSRFTLSGNPGAAVTREILGAVSLAFRGTATPGLPSLSRIWGIPVGVISRLNNLIFLGTREYGVFHEQRGNIAIILPVSGEFTVVPILGTLSGSAGMRFSAAGQPSVTLNAPRLLTGSPRMTFAPGGTPTNITAPPAGHPAEHIFFTEATEPAWGVNAVMVDVNLGDGVTDVRAQLQAAFDSAFDQGKHVILPQPANFYAISSPLILRTSLGGSVSGVVGSQRAGAKPRIHTTNVSTGFTSQGDILIIPNGVQNVYIKNVHLSGTYTNGHPGTEDPQGISLGGVYRVTIRYCRIADIRGDCSGQREALWTVASAPGTQNIIIRDCELLNPFRCAFGFTWHASNWNIIDNFVDKDNAVDAGASFVSGLDIEPEVRNGVGGNVSSIEVSYNLFSMDNRTVNFGRGADGMAAFRWQVPGNNNPGGNHYLHHNYGTFGTGFWGEGGTWGSLFLDRNIEGNTVP